MALEDFHVIMRDNASANIISTERPATSVRNLSTTSQPVKIVTAIQQELLLNLLDVVLCQLESFVNARKESKEEYAINADLSIGI